MFGSLCFLIRGHLLAGVWKDSLIARVGQERAQTGLSEPHVRPMDITGQPMKGWLLITPDGVESDAQLRAWIGAALEFVERLPPK